MSDFNTQLSTMLDDVAASINPRPNFDAMRATPVPVVSNGAGMGRRFPRLLGVAAVSVSLLGGGVAAFQIVDQKPDNVATSSEVIREPIAKTSPRSGDFDKQPGAGVVVAPQYDDVHAEPSAEFKYAAELGRFELDGDLMHQKIVGRAAPGEEVVAASELGRSSVRANDDGKWGMVLKLTDVPEGTKVPIRVTFERSSKVFELVVVRPADPKPETTEPPKPETTEPPKPETTEPPKPETTEPPKPEPKPEEPKPVPAIEFRVSNGDAYNNETYLMHSFWGTAPAGSVVTVGSEWGSAETVAGPKGEWELRFKLAEVPDGTAVHVRVSANTGGPVYEFKLVRDKPGSEPEPVGFRANLGEGHLDWNPMKQGFYGTGTPGSVVIARTEFGAADAVVNSKGKWEMLLKMYEVPGGTTVGVRVTNNASEAVFEFGLVRPATEPTPVDFTAQAAFTTCDSTPPFNEYWGMSTAGATITIGSAYGNKQVMSNGDGHWEARVEFPEAPFNETFMVTVTSSKGEATYSFPLTRLGPA